MRRAMLAAAAAALCLGATQAVAQFSGVRQIAHDPDSATDSQVAFAEAPDGRAVAAWRVDWSAGEHARNAIEASVRSRRGNWSKPVKISGGGSGAVRVSLPAVAVDDRGDAVITWLREDLNAGRSAVQFAAHNGSGRWSKSTTVGAGQFHDVAAAGGRALIVWSQPGNGGRSDVKARWYRRGRFGPARTIGTSRLLSALHVELSSSTAGAVTVDDAPGGSSGDRVLAWRIAHGAIKPPGPLAQGASLSVLCASRAVAAAWVADGEIRTRVLGRSGRWGRTAHVADGGRFPSCSANRRGGVIVAWVSERSGAAMAAVRSPRGAWGDAVTLSAAGAPPAVRISVAFSRSDSAIAAWLESDPQRASTGVSGAARSSQGSWAVATTVVPEGAATPIAGIDDRGNALVVFANRGFTSVSSARS